MARLLRIDVEGGYDLIPLVRAILIAVAVTLAGALTCAAETGHVRAARDGEAEEIALAPVPNPSFEGVDAVQNPIGWTLHLRGQAKGGTVTEGRQGRCLMLENVEHEDQAVACSDLFAVEPYQNYRLTFWHRARDPIVRHAEVWVYFGEKNANGGCRNFTVTTTREWQQATVDFTSPKIRQTALWFVLCPHSENSQWFVDEVELRRLGAARVNPETIAWKAEPTTLMKNVGGLFTRVQGPLTSRPLTSVTPLTALQVVNVARPATPIMDGIVGEGEYAPWAATIGPRRGLSDGLPLRDNTRTYVLYDDQRLYLAWQATYREETPLAAVKPEQRDGPVYNDDAVEVLFVIPGGPFIHFIGNAMGAMYDDREGDLAWNGNWHYKASVRPGIWDGEASIAWQDLGLSGPPSDGSEWLFDVCRTSPSYGEQGKWCWLDGVGGFVNKKYMGRLRFDAKGWTFHLTPLTSRVGDNQATLYVPMSREQRGSLIWGLSLFDDTGKEIMRQRDILTPRPGDLFVWPFKYQLPTEGLYSFSTSVQDPATGTEVFQLTAPLAAQPDLQITTRVLPFRGQLRVTADAPGLVGSKGQALQVRVVLCREGKTVLEGPLAHTPDKSFGGAFSLAGLSPATYDLKASLSQLDGKILATASKAVVVPPRPVWLGNGLGKVDRVAAPFTPVRVAGRKVSVWDRDYLIGANGLPEQIISAGQPLLAAPVSAELIARSKPVPVKTGQTRTVRASATRAELAASVQGMGPSLSVRSTTEFDGLVKLAFTLDPGGKPLGVERFTLRFPFRRCHALYLDAPVTAPPFHHVIDKEGWSLDRSLTVGTGDTFGRFWIGDDDRGVDFDFISDEGWQPYDRPDVIHIERHGGRVTVDLNILGRHQLTRPLHGQLLISATPLRPFPEDLRHQNAIVWDGRPMQVVPGVDTYGAAGLKTFADLGANRLMVSDHWAMGYGRPEPFDPPSFHNLMHTAKGLGMKVIIYTGGLNGCWSQEVGEKAYLDEWQANPEFRMGNGGRPDQNIISVCLTHRNGGQDCLVWLLHKIIHDYGIDGIYVDGAGWAPSKALDQGFGYRDEQGHLRATNNIMQTRELFKRVVNLFQEHGKQPILQHHASWMPAAPVDSFSTSHLTGEYAAYRATEGTVLPESYFRIENTGRQWGLPVDVLVYNGSLLQRYFANTFIYGCAPAVPLSSFLTSPNVDSIRQFSPIWKGFAGYDVSGAQWVPYWQAEPLVRSANPAHRVSFYRHPKQGLLLLVGNTSHDPGMADLTLDLRALGLAGKTISARNLNREARDTRLAGNRLALPLSADDFVMVQVRRS